MEEIDKESGSALLGIRMERNGRNVKRRKSSMEESTVYGRGDMQIDLVRYSVASLDPLTC